MKDNNREKSESCQCCSYETENLKWFPTQSFSPLKEKWDYDGVWLCDLCSSTMTSGFDEYSHQHDNDQLEIMKTICYVGNSIIDAIKQTNLLEKEGTK